MKKTLILGGLTGLLLIGAVYYGVRAQEPRQPMKRPGIEHMNAMRERIQLNLTDEQKDKIRGIMTATRKEIIKLTADLEVGRIELDELMRDKSAPQPTILGKQKEILSLQNTVAERRLNARLQVRDIMTDEQWEKAGKLRGFMMMRHRMRNAGPGGPMNMRREFMRGPRHMGPWGFDGQDLTGEEWSILPDSELAIPEDDLGLFLGELKKDVIPGEAGPLDLPEGGGGVPGVVPHE